MRNATLALLCLALLALFAAPPGVVAQDGNTNSVIMQIDQFTTGPDFVFAVSTVALHTVIFNSLILMRVVDFTSASLSPNPFSLPEVNLTGFGNTVLDLFANYRTQYRLPS